MKWAAGGALGAGRNLFERGLAAQPAKSFHENREIHVQTHANQVSLRQTCRLEGVIDGLFGFGRNPSCDASFQFFAHWCQMLPVWHFMSTKVLTKIKKATNVRA